MKVKLRWVRHLPVLMVMADRLTLQGTSALNLIHITFVKRAAWNDEPLIRHELRHAEQAISRFYFGFLIRWMFSQRFRLWAEVDAYRVQLSMVPSGGVRDAVKDRLAASLSEHYHSNGIYWIFPIRVTKERASALFSMSIGSPV